MDERIEHAPKWPWIVAVLFLIGVAVVGAVLSQNRRADVPPSIGSSTTSVIPSTTAATETGGVPSPAPVAQVAPVADACTDEQLVEAVRRSGEVTESLVQTIRVERSRCADDYAYARLQSEVGPADAYLKAGNGFWTVLALGTSIEPASLGIPGSVLAALRA